MIIKGVLQTPSASFCSADCKIVTNYYQIDSSGIAQTSYNFNFHQSPKQKFFEIVIIEVRQSRKSAPRHLRDDAEAIVSHLTYMISLSFKQSTFRKEGKSDSDIQIQSITKIGKTLTNEMEMISKWLGIYRLLINLKKDL